MGVVLDDVMVMRCDAVRGKVISLSGSILDLCQWRVFQS